MPSRRPAERVQRKMQRKKALRNGTESREMLPLWQKGRVTMPSRRPAERAQREKHSATAPDCGICCRCGKRAEWQCRPEGLQKGRSGKKHSATAPNCGICCRCGKGAGNRPGRQPSRQTKQTKSDGTNRNRPNRRKQSRPGRKQQSGLF